MANDNCKISFPQLVTTISAAIDLISPVLNNHHQQTAYICYQIARELGLAPERLRNLTTAALLHDIGALSLRERIELLEFEEEDPYRHTIAGYVLLRDLALLREAAEIIKHHHLAWQKGGGRSYGDENVHPESHILYLADRIAVAIDGNAKVLDQVQTIRRRIKEQAPQRFCPRYVQAFVALSAREAFWLDLVSPDIGDRLMAIWGDNVGPLGLEETYRATKVFARVIDFRSRFTAVHSSGVGAVAAAMVEKMNWSQGDCLKMKIAGNLHDLGKLAINTDILEKTGRLTVEEYNIMKTHAYYSHYLLGKIDGFGDINEYASLHHERMDGSGYPFHMTGKDLREGSRVMAIADVLTAITEDRPYRKGMGKEKALEIVEEKALTSKLDAEIVSLVRQNFTEINAAREQAQREAAEGYRAFEQEINLLRGYYR